MRWHIQGTDATTGQDITLALDEPEAAHAVQSALARRILVNRVSREAGEGLRRMAFPFACAAAVVLLPIAGYLYYQNFTVRDQLTSALKEQTRLAQTVAQAETLSAQIRQSPVTPAGDADRAEKMRQLADQLAAARSRMNLTEQQLSNVHENMNKLEVAARELPMLQTQLAFANKALSDSESRLATLQQESALQRRRLAELADLPAPVAPPPPTEEIQKLERSNKELATQIDLLKSQLLLAAAQSTQPAHAPAEVSPEPQAPARWALRAEADAAISYLALNFNRETFNTSTLPDGTMVTTGSRPANAATLRILHDKPRDRVYAGTLTLSLAPDAPKTIRAENTALAVGFLKTFAPGCLDPDATVAAAVGQISPKNPAHRISFLGSDYKLTAWASAQNMISLKVESPRPDLEE